MSYILEALKQAEEERGSDRLSTPPSIRTVAEPQQESIDWKKWLTIAILINAVVLLAWVAWKYVSITADRESPAQTAHINTNSMTGAERPAAEKSPVFSSSPVRTPANSTNGTQAQSPAEKKQASKAKAVVPTVDRPEQTTSEMADVPEAKPELPKLKPTTEMPIGEIVIPKSEPEVAAEPKSESQPVQSPELEVAPVPETATVAKVEPLPASSREQLLPELPAKTIEPSPDIAQPVAPKQIAAVQRSPVPEYAELPYSVQQKIPEIRISVHIYNNEPQLRKVRVNGRIFYEGEEVERNLTIEEITPHGVIFKHAKTEFRLNLR